MTHQEQLDKFKVEYRPKEEYSLLIAITGQSKFLGVVYKKVDIVTSARYKNRKEVAEAHIYYTKVDTIEQFIKDLTPYINKL